MKQGSVSKAVINKGLYVPSGKVRFISEVDKSMRGLTCNCICFGCGEKLLAALGDVNIDHFRHVGESKCKGGQETALHQAAKEILVEKSFINTARFGVIHFTDGIPEQELVSTRPDVTALFQQRPIYFEIAVKHFIELEKNNFFTSGKHRSIEIDLSKLNTLALREEIENAVLHELNNKNIIYWDPETKNKISGNKEFKLHPVAIIALLITAIWLIRNFFNWLWRRKKK